jgi:crotonobetainyl-CoA:carnitine CoA-transferase CaiB-like acyl-CoA transferase
VTETKIPFGEAWWATRQPRSVRFGNIRLQKRAACRQGLGRKGLVFCRCRLTPLDAGTDSMSNARPVAANRCIDYRNICPRGYILRARNGALLLHFLRPHRRTCKACRALQVQPLVAKRFGIAKLFAEFYGRAMVKPLDGVRVVEISQVYALPFAGMMLAELGADVIKIENPQAPEIMRRGGNIRGGIPAAFWNLNRGKRFVGIDALRPEGAEALDAVIASADVFLSNLRPGKLAHIGVDYNALHTRNTGLVSIDVTGFGSDGPNAELPCYDFVVQALTGMIDYQRDPLTDKHDLVRNFVIDKTVSHAVVEGVLAALLVKSCTGEGQHVEINLLDVGMHFLWPDGMAIHSYLDPIESRPVGDGGDLYRVYPTLDGSVAMMPSLSEWSSLCALIDRMDLIADERFAERLDFVTNNIDATRIVGDEIANMTTDDVLQKCAMFDIPVAKVNRRVEAFDDEQIVWNQTVGVHTVPDVGRARAPRPPWRFSSSAVTVQPSIAKLGAHTSEVLREAGMSPDRIEELITMQVLHQT